MEIPVNLYDWYTVEELAQEIRDAGMWEGEMLTALAWRLGVDLDDLGDDCDCDQVADYILEKTGVDLYEY